MRLSVALISMTLVGFGSIRAQDSTIERVASDSNVTVGDVERAIPGHVDQRDVELGKWSIAQLQRAGERLFVANFTTADGAGRPEARTDELPRRRRITPNSQFVRTAGPDANACSSCHHQPEIGGAGDFVANAFLGLGEKPSIFQTTDRSFSNERGTPEIHGAGIIEQLAREITEDLQHQRDRAIEKAISGKAPVKVALESKSVSYGQIKVHPDGFVDASKIDGIDQDLVIRPFGAKGTVVSLRHFTVNAANQHHGMQADERFGRDHSGSDDFDSDGVKNELTVGDVTALTVFQATLNMPGQVLPDDEELKTEIARGEILFQTSKCASCHVPTMPMRSATFSEPSKWNFRGTLTHSDVSKPVVVDLIKDVAGPHPKHLPSGELLVHPFTDFKRHVICDEKRPHFGNENVVQRRVDTRAFVTKRLWAVGNTAPYGHRGDVTTIWEAISHHGGEANESREEFELLTEKDQIAVIRFLRSLQIVPSGSPSPLIRPVETPLPYR